MDRDYISAVGRTALAVAAARAVESRRPDAWFTDPLAAVLFRNRALPELPGWLAPSVAARTRFLDELVLAAAARGATQIVIVGAGLDARAFRLALGDNVSVFEVDRVDILDVKNGLIEDGDLIAACRRQVVFADVTDEAWLGQVEEAGWQPLHPTIWLLEGFLVYFEQDFRVQLLSALARASAPGSVLGATMSSQRGRLSHPLWFPAPEAGTQEWLSAIGWRAQTTTAFDASTRYGRPPSEQDRAALQGELVEARNSWPTDAALASARNE